MTIDNQIKDKKIHHDINTEAAKYHQAKLINKNM